MAGYSGTPLPQKLGIKQTSRVRLFAAPQGFARSVGVVSRPRGEADVIVLFTRSAAALQRDFPRVKKALHTAGGLWIAWPQNSPGMPTPLRPNPTPPIP